MTRKPIIVGNWKMNNDLHETRALLSDIHDRLASKSAQVDVGVAPPATFLAVAGEILADDLILLAAQNVHYADSGAFTGEVSPRMLKSLGVDLVIVGHSERRHYFAETDELVNRKVKAALSVGLVAIVCVGETLEEREAGQTLEKVSTQVRGAFDGLSAQQASTIVLAYEPVWAIGTGRTATPEQAQEVHRALRDLLTELYDAPTADAIRIQYGGSVKPHNAESLLSQPDIDGALVGGASLKGDAFEAIVNAALSNA